MSYVKDDDFSDNIISFFGIKHYSFNLLSKSRNVSPKPVPDILPLDSTISDDIKRKAFELLEEDKKYNIKHVNQYVKNFLKDYSRRKISELAINSKYEFIMIICIIMYSKLPEAIYQVNLLNERIIRNGISFNDYIVELKGGIINDEFR